MNLLNGKSKEKEKWLLVTAIYGMHPDGSELPPFEGKKTPGDVQSRAFLVRDKLNLLRKKNKLLEIEHPQIASATTEEINRNINNIQSIAEQTAAGAEQTAA